MKIYTKTGDQGTTGLIGGARVGKHDIQIESYGTVDELNSWLGLIRDQGVDEGTKNALIIIQKNLFDIGAILATDPEKALGKKMPNTPQVPEIQQNDIVFLEEQIDAMDATLPRMTHFILPGGHTMVSYCHIARTVCRRAERRCTSLQENYSFNQSVLVFLNRLSDYLFVLARKLSQDNGVVETRWIPDVPEKK